RPTIPVGRPLHNKTVYILDPHLNPVPIGVPGHIHMAGPGLAHGYLHQPALTAERFIANPHQPGTRMYRTGDLGRWNPDGTIDYLGRTDEQTKIRGFRIEPAETQTTLQQHPHIRHNTVIVREDHPGDKTLVAYVVPEPESGLDEASLRAHAAHDLPEHLRPSAYVVLDRLPLNPNGKLDRAALPAPDLGNRSTGRAPRTREERALCALYGELLGLEEVGPEEDFFDLGGHSLLVARLISRVRSTLGADVSLKTVFRARTPAALAGRLDRTAPARPALRRRTRTEETQ
ncbi:phosphopantetheine-binding protein, partial [Streptomyces sp. NPDC047065]|uniref:phosphopantetheine-binding protein n=1 Tax=Streptomyces sp. NPDC047065 TaxID=3154606 RepID=UPI0033FD47EE